MADTLPIVSLRCLDPSAYWKIQVRDPPSRRRIPNPGTRSSKATVSILPAGSLSAATVLAVRCMFYPRPGKVLVMSRVARCWRSCAVVRLMISLICRGKPSSWRLPDGAVEKSGDAFQADDEGSIPFTRSKSSHRYRHARTGRSPARGAAANVTDAMACHQSAKIATEREDGQTGGVGLEPDRGRSRCRPGAGYRGHRGLHENLGARQADGLPAEQRQLPAAARDQERARGLAEAQRRQCRDRRTQSHRERAAKNGGAAAGRAEGGGREEAGEQVAGAAGRTGGRGLCAPSGLECRAAVPIYGTVILNLRARRRPTTGPGRASAAG